MDTSQAHSNHFGLYNLSNLWPTKATFRHFHLSLSLNPLKRRNFGYNKLLFAKSWTVFEVYPFVSSTLGIWITYSQLAKLAPFSLRFPISHFQHISAFFITYSQMVSFHFLTTSLHHDSKWDHDAEYLGNFILQDNWKLTVDLNLWFRNWMGRSLSAFTRVS